MNWLIYIYFHKKSTKEIIILRKKTICFLNLVSSLANQTSNKNLYENMLHEETSFSLKN